MAEAAETAAPLARIEAIVARTLADAAAAHADADAAHEEAEALAERLRRARQDVADAVEAPEQALDRLAAEAEEQEERLEALAARFHEALDALAETLDDHEDALDAAADGAADAVAAELSAAQQTSRQLDERLGQGLEQIDALRQEADAILARIAEAGGELRDGIDAIDEHLDALVELLDRTVTEVATLFEHRLAAVDELLGRARLDALDAGQRAFLDDALRRLASGTDGLGDALDALGDGAREGRGQIEGGAGRLLDQMQGVVQAIDRLRPVLDLIQELLT